MKIETKAELETLDTRTSRIIVHVFVDGFPCGKTSVASGKTSDMEDLFNGEMTMADLRKKWGLLRQAV